ncbi:acyl-CoA dehydrogenase family protein [Jannaschia sp. R86511]|uniref:acyl-CoA dehydrogenase family protein n=1 Tax=Jannaschia sp. R86511 TaxID=3093853 RepID=UPI0036D22D28
MVPDDRRTRRPRQDETVIDLRQAAATRNRGADSPEVLPTVGDTDLAAADQALLDAVRRHGGPALLPGLHELGRHVGAVAQRALAEAVEASPPRLQAFDGRGERVDRVLTHPGWSQLQCQGTEAGLAGRPWQAAGEGHAHLARAAGLLLWAQTSGSSAMALSTHYAAAAALVDSPAAAQWLPRLASRRLDTGSRRAAAKPGCSAGVAVTERSSSAPGSSPATTATRALGGPVEGGPTWRLSGRKWFAGNADADALLVTATTEQGTGVFLLPRRLDDGSTNGVRTQRLRPGHAYRAWVVGDLELDAAWAVRLDSGPGASPLQALQAARSLDATVLAAADARALLSRVGHHARHRVVPGGPLDTAPLARTLLADLAVESEAATVLALHLAAATDAAHPDGGPGAPGGPGTGDAAEAAALLRLAAPVGAAWASRRAPQVALEALECLGGAGWDDDSDVARLLRDSSAVLAGATGSGLALEAVRVVADDADAVEAFVAECERSRGGHPRLDAAVTGCVDLLRTAGSEARQDLAAVQGAARWLSERLAVTLQACLVVRACPSPVAEAYLAARLDGAGTRGLGTLPLGARQTALVVDRALGDA